MKEAVVNNKKQGSDYFRYSICFNRSVEDRHTMRGKFFQTKNLKEPEDSYANTLGPVNIHHITQ